jgi:hypothetical protein
MTQQLQINPQHDPEALGQVLQKDGRLQVTDFFSADTADYLHKIHMENEDWGRRRSQRQTVTHQIIRLAIS